MTIGADVADAVEFLRENRGEHSQAAKPDDGEEAVVGELDHNDAEERPPAEEGDDDGQHVVEDGESEEPGDGHGDDDESAEEDDADHDGDPEEQDGTGDPDAESGKKKGKFRKLKERAQAAESRVRKYEENIPVLVENAEWFQAEYEKKVRELRSLEIENERLASRLEKYQIPDFDSEAEKRAHLAEARLREIQETEQRAQEEAQQRAQDAVRRDLQPVVERIVVLSERANLDPKDVAMAFATRRKTDPSVTVEKVVNLLAAASDSAKRASLGKSQAKANRSAPKRRIAKGGVSDVKDYPNTVEGATQFLKDKRALLNG